MNISHTLSTCKHYVYSTIILLAMTLFLAGCPSPVDFDALKTWQAEFKKRLLTPALHEVQ